MRIAGFAPWGLPFFVAGCFTVQMAPVGADADVMELAVDVVGDWHGCAGELNFGADGSASLRSDLAACTTQGTYVVEGHRLHATWDTPACSGSATWDREAVRVVDGLVLVDVVNGRSTRFVGDATPRSLWRLDASDGTGASTTMRILGSSETGLIDGCYWSTDLACGGIVSCGGMVSEWSTNATSFHATTVCTGDCPCAAAMTGSATTSGRYDATFTGANCGRVLSGAFTATPIEVH